MCFERDDCCNMASVCELVAPAASRPLRQFAQTVCWLAGTQPHTAKFACRLNGGRAAEQPRHQGESGWWGRKLAPGSAPAAYRWLAGGGQLGLRRLDGRGPATASRCVTRPGAEVQGEPTAASSSAAWLA